jgi:hypothetical protein
VCGEQSTSIHIMMSSGGHGPYGMFDNSPHRPRASPASTPVKPHLKSSGAGPSVKSSPTKKTGCVPVPRQLRKVFRVREHRVLLTRRCMCNLQLPMPQRPAHRQLSPRRPGPRQHHTIIKPAQRLLRKPPLAPLPGVYLSKSTADKHTLTLFHAQYTHALCLSPVQAVHKMLPLGEKHGCCVYVYLRRLMVSESVIVQ